VPREVIQILKNPDILVIETNYHPVMLRNGIYPPHLKAKIESRFGHLSNLDGGKAAVQIVGPKTKHVVLAHISKNNNTPETALNNVTSIFKLSSLPLPSLHLTWHERHTGPFFCTEKEG